jgi:hypothetical protein
LDPSLQALTSVTSLLRASKVIAFDGDAIHSESFTKFLVHLLAERDDNNSAVDCNPACSEQTYPAAVSVAASVPVSAPQLLAYRLDYSELLTDSDNLPADVLHHVECVSRPALLQSWHQRVVTLHEVGGHLTIALERDSDRDSDGGGESSPPLEVTIFVKTLTPSTSPDERSPFEELGLQALLNSGSSQVLAIGGGEVVRREYELYENRIPTLQWTVWPVSRPAREGGNREECHFRSLLSERAGALLSNVRFLEE